MNWTRPIEISTIEIGDRLRPVDPDAVEALTVSLQESGLLEPIVVRPLGDRRFGLLAGAHRLAAASQLGWESIDGTIRNDIASDAHARLIEIDENLIRRELEPLDRAIFMAERKAAWEAAFPETAHGKAKKTKKNQQNGKVAKIATFAQRFTKDSAERLGISERLVQLAVQMAEGLTPEARALARQCYVAGHQNDLLKISVLDPEQQIAALTRIVTGEAKSLRDAIGVHRETAAHDQVARLIDLFSRLGKVEQDRFLTAIGAIREAKKARSSTAP